MKSQYEGTCPVCSAEWKVNDEIFLSKVNGSWIKCTDKECFEQQRGKIEQPKSSKFTSNKFPITEAIPIYRLAETILEEFQKKRFVRIDPNSATTATVKLNDVLSAEQEAVFIESMFRTLSGNFKP